MKESVENNLKILKSYKKIAKSMLIEHAWERKFGKPLPTLEDVIVEFKKNLKPTDGSKEVTFTNKDNYDKAKKSGDYEEPEGGEEKPKSKGHEPDNFERDFEDDPDDIDDLPDDGEPEGGEQNIPSDDEIDSYQEKLNTYTGPYSDGNEIHSKWEGITTKVWAETSEEEYKDDPDHPLNKPSDSEWADTVGEEVRALAMKHFSDFGDELKDASPEAKAYFKEKGLPPSGKEGGKEESITINGKKYIPIKESVEPKKHLLRETYERIGGK